MTIISLKVWLAITETSLCSLEARREEFFQVLLNSFASLFLSPFQPICLYPFDGSSFLNSLNSTLLISYFQELARLLGFLVLLVCGSVGHRGVWFSCDTHFIVWFNNGEEVLKTHGQGRLKYTEDAWFFSTFIF